MDADRIRAVIAEAAPDAVIHLVTALPKSGPMRASQMRATNALRIHGTRHLLDAAIAVGARRFMAESFFINYGFEDRGARPLAEDAPVPLQRAGVPVRIGGAEESVIPNDCQAACGRVTGFGSNALSSTSRTSRARWMVMACRTLSGTSSRSPSLG